MIIADYVPALTPQEVKRFWLTPVEVCRLAQVGEVADPKIKKMLNTLSDRGHVPFVKSGTAKTAPRLYSLESAAMLRTIAEIIEDGRTYVYAVAVAKKVCEGMNAAVERLDDLSTFDSQFASARLLFSGIEDGKPGVLKWSRRDTPYNGWSLSYSFFDAGYLILRLLGTYADFWAADLAKSN